MALIIGNELSGLELGTETTSKLIYTMPLQLNTVANHMFKIKNSKIEEGVREEGKQREGKREGERERKGEEKRERREAGRGKDRKEANQ